MGVKVNQGDGLTLATEVSSQVSGHSAFANATFLTGDQNFECRHHFSSVLIKQHVTFFVLQPVISSGGLNLHGCRTFGQWPTSPIDTGSIG
jgi:hypothetical protein